MQQDMEVRALEIGKRYIVLQGLQALGFSTAGKATMCVNPNAIFYWISIQSARDWIELHPEFKNTRVGIITFEIREI